MSDTTLPKIVPIGRIRIIVDAKTAAENAKKYYESIAGVVNARVSVEEVELENNYWYITLGISRKTNSVYTLSQGIDEVVTYKIFKIDKTNGKVVSMKIKGSPYLPSTK